METFQVLKFFSAFALLDQVFFFPPTGPSDIKATWAQFGLIGVICLLISRQALSKKRKTYVEIKSRLQTAGPGQPDQNYWLTAPPAGLRCVCVGATKEQHSTVFR